MSDSTISRQTLIAQVLPAASLTLVSMLAMDVYLPSVPAIQRDLGMSVAQGQMTLSLFLLGMALSQLVWGECHARLGVRTTSVVGMGLLTFASLGSVLTNDAAGMLIMRGLQGVGAGAATVVAPAILKARLPDRYLTQGVGLVAAIESVVPAVGPVVGATLLQLSDWRSLLVLIAVLSTMALWGAIAFVKDAPLPPSSHAAQHLAASGYRALLADKAWMPLASSHALAVAALLTFVASAPQMLKLHFGAGPREFAMLQVAGVSGFMLTTVLLGRYASMHKGREIGLVRVGAVCHALLVLAWWALTLVLPVSLWSLGVFWVLYCAILGARGPATFSLLLSVATVQVGRAAGLLTLFTLGACAAATQVTALWLEQHPLAAVQWAIVGLALASLASARCGLNFHAARLPFGAHKH